LFILVLVNGLSCVSSNAIVVVQLSVPVQLIVWKDSSPKQWSCGLCQEWDDCSLTHRV